jgi:hypothetical protein
MRTAKDGVGEKVGSKMIKQKAPSQVSPKIITILYNIAHIAQECFEELHNIVQYCVHC